MKTPRTPPTIPVLMSKLTSDQFSRVLAFVSSSSPTNKYLHWDKLIRYTPPAGLTHEEWWLGLKIRRNSLYQSLPLTDAHGQPFKILVTDPMPERLHHIELGPGGRIRVPAPLTNAEPKD